MSYEDIVALVGEIDNLVCAKGVRLFTWYLQEQEEFNAMLYTGKPYRLQMIDTYEYQNKLLDKIDMLNYEESKELLNKHKELWLTLIQKSELSNRYFTSNDDDLFKRITPLARQEFVILLNEYNFIPESLLREYERNAMIELGRHEVMSYVIGWKKELLNRYYIINKLQSKHIRRYAYGNDRFQWAINRRQLLQLVTLFKRYFLSTTQEGLIVNILLSIENGNIVWLKKTEALAYLFTQLVRMKFLLTEDWGMVITRRLMFCSKQGNIITHRNINSSTYRLNQKETRIGEKKNIDGLLRSFERNTKQ